MANRFKVDSRKYPSDKGCTVAITGALEEVVELGWLHAKMHHAHKDEEEKGIKGYAVMTKRRMIRQTVSQTMAVLQAITQDSERV